MGRTYLHCYNVNHGQMFFIVEAGELIKIRYNFHNALRESGSKPFIVEAGELICLGSKPFIFEAGELISSGSKPFIVEAGELIRYNFQSALQEFWVEAMIT